TENEVHRLHANERASFALTRGAAIPRGSLEGGLGAIEVVADAGVAIARLHEAAAAFGHRAPPLDEVTRARVAELGDRLEGRAAIGAALGELHVDHRAHIGRERHARAAERARRLAALAPRGSLRE